MSKKITKKEFLEYEKYRIMGFSPNFSMNKFGKEKFTEMASKYYTFVNEYKKDVEKLRNKLFKEQEESRRDIMEHL